jgi:pilus assembly protein CpaF
MERSGIISNLLEGPLRNPRVTDICLNGCSGVFIDEGDGMRRISYPDKQPITEEAVREWVLEQMSLVGKTWDAKLPFVDASLPSGHRLHVAFPPLAQQGILVSLRKIPTASDDSRNADTTAKRRWQESPFFSSLWESVQAGDSILISGATGSGKTTLANDLLAAVPGHERIIALEDTRELAPGHPHFLTLVSRPPNSDGYGEVTLRALLRQTLRMRPDRIILGECRGAEVLELLQALNTGHRGSMATLHANSPREALRRIELLCLLAAAGSVPIGCIRELLSMGVQWIAQVKRQPEGRKIQELWKIEGREGDTILMRQMLECDFKRRDGSTCEKSRPSYPIQ